MGDRGYVLSWDALISLSVVLLVLMGFIALPYFRSLRAGEVGFQQIHLMTEDVMETLSKEGKLRKISDKWAEGEYTTPPASPPIDPGLIVGASRMARDLLDPVVPEKAGYMMIVDDEIIYSTDWDQLNRPKEESAKDKTRSVRHVSGLAPEQTETGWVARAHLVGNITRTIDTLRWEGAGGDDLTDLYLNLNASNTEEIVYLVVPKNARIMNGSMNLTWNTSAWPECPMLS